MPRFNPYDPGSGAGPEPTAPPAPRKRSKKATTLSPKLTDIIEDLNGRHTPPGGWDAGDSVSSAAKPIVDDKVVTAIRGLSHGMLDILRARKCVSFDTEAWRAELIAFHQRNPVHTDFRKVIESWEPTQTPPAAPVPKPDPVTPLPPEPAAAPKPEPPKRSDRERKVQARTDLRDIKHLLSKGQCECIADCLRGEEWEWFSGIVAEVKVRFETMSKIGEQDGIGDEAIVLMHYFVGGCDWLITERDTSLEQHQAFGWACLGDPWTAELGYISIAEITQHGAELDLHWRPVTLTEAKASILGRRAGAAPSDRPSFEPDVEFGGEPENTPVTTPPSAPDGETAPAVVSAPAATCGVGTLQPPARFKYREYWRQSRRTK